MAKRTKAQQGTLQRGTPRFDACVSVFGSEYCESLIGKKWAGDKGTAVDSYFCQPCTDDTDEHKAKMAKGVASWFTAQATDVAIKEANDKRKKLLIGFASYWELPT